MPCVTGDCVGSSVERHAGAKAGGEVVGINSFHRARVGGIAEADEDGIGFVVRVGHLKPARDPQSAPQFLHAAHALGMVIGAWRQVLPAQQIGQLRCQAFQIVGVEHAIERSSGAQVHRHGLAIHRVTQGVGIDSDGPGAPAVHFDHAGAAAQALGVCTSTVSR